MGIDWETILGAEGTDLADAYEDYVGPWERRPDFDDCYSAQYSEPNDADDCADSCDSD